MRYSWKLKHIPVFPCVIIASISLFALLTLYSINSGNFFPWSFKQFFRFMLGVLVLIIGVLTPISFWKKHAYIFYIVGIIMLISVEVAGKASMGAQRWLNLYFFNFQPSELMRIFLIITLAKYFSTSYVDDVKKNISLVAPIALIAIPMGLVLLQPDLGTAMLFFLVGTSIFFVSGVQIWKFFVLFGAALVSAPIFWSLLHEYQKNRILMFLSPEMDPSGAGYHIIQSQIAIGSGGFWGKGLLNGSQCQLNFLPEKQTDFVFAALGEELGFFGCCILIFLYCLLLAYNLSAALRVRNRFEQILIFGLNSMLFFYIFINISMVCGLLPVVGIPLPFFSYGGSALVVLMFCQGIIFSADIEQRNNVRLRL